MSLFSTSDTEQIKKHGLTIETVTQQLHDFQSGFPYCNIVEPAIIGNGITPTPDANVAKHYMNNRNKYKIVKFVPASGAATRMFKDLFAFLDNGEMNRTTETVLKNLEKFAFYDEVKKFITPDSTDTDIVKHIISRPGLNYGNLPKALLAFHKYPNENRTALEEHLIEGALYAESNKTVNIHFTISPEHQDGFDELLRKILPVYENKFKVKYNISMSVQLPHTDTIAVNPDNTPFRTSDGELLFRPAGHGALIENLNNIDADLIFIKNIDNICTDRMRDITIYNKQLLAGIAITIQEQIFKYIRDIDNNTANALEIVKFINNTLGIRGIPTGASSDTLRSILNRPLRICGMIKNTGEPGGGPFWTRSTRTKYETLQIAEPGQIAPSDKHILTDGEFFSPTDLVCAVRDAYGNKFDLTKYIDTTTGFISEKSANGKPLRAMERPGLWNGSMSDWNTVFTAVPLETFTPVKVISDLILPNHLT